MAGLSVKQLVAHFEEKLRRENRFAVGRGAGSEPHYPLIVVYLGREAAAGHSWLHRQLLQVWPQYEEELYFVGAEPAENGGARYFEMSVDDAGAHSADIDERRVFQIVERLHGTSTHFQDRRRLLVYYVLSTTAFAAVDDLQPWLKVVRAVRGVLMCEQLSMLAVLLDEGFGHAAVGGAVRGRLAAMQRADELQQYGAGSVFLLSSKREDSAILEDWRTCYHILAALILLSNNAQTAITLPMFAGGIKTVCYARQEKPLAEIGQVVVRCMLEELETLRAAGKSARLLEDDTLPERLGLTADGVFRVLDEFAQRNLLPQLPTEQDLERFPRRTDADCGALSALSAREFDELTMGAWECYLGGVVEKARERLASDAGLRAEWQQSYGEQLSRSFTAEELIYLAAHRRELAELCASPRAPQDSGGVLQAAGARLRYILCCERALTDIFLDAVERRGEEAGAVLSSWTALQQSVSTLFTVKDRNLEEFYARRVRNYFDRNRAKKGDAFRRVQSAQELEAFLHTAIDEIVDSDAIFYAPFEEELEQRLQEESNPVNAKTYIRQKLTGDEVYRYLLVHSNLGQAFLSSILLQYGTPLHDSLAGTLDASTFYYDTGCGDRAEAVQLFEVPPDTLIIG